jgi:hypothetical protein
MQVWVGFNSRFNAVPFNLIEGIRSIQVGRRQVRPGFHRHLKVPLEKGTSPFGLHRESGGPYRKAHVFFDQEQSAVTGDLDYRRSHSDRSLGLATILALLSLEFVHRHLIVLQHDNEGDRRHDICCFCGDVTCDHRRH